MESMVSAKYKILIPISIRKRYKINEKARLKWIDNGHSINLLPISNLKSVYKDYSHKGKSQIISGRRNRGSHCYREIC